MTFLAFEEKVKELIGKVAPHRVEYQLMEPRRPEYGDLASNVSFRLAKVMRRPPQEIAENLAERISGMLDKEDIVGGVEAVSGFLNFRVNFPILARKTLEAVFRLGDRYGSSNIGAGRKVLVEHTNVNPNKAIHIGHARNSCLGDSLVRILRFAGFRVYALNYIDDTGSQVADVIVGFRYLGMPMEPPKGMRFDKYCGDHVYVKVNQLYEERPELLKYRREVLRRIEEGDNEVARFTRAIADRVVRDQLKTCWRLGVYFDLFNWESDIVRSGLWEEVFQLMKERGAVRLETDGEYAGCWVISLKDIPRFAEETDKVLVRSDGTLTYIAKDLPYAAWKIGLVSGDFKYSLYLTQPNGKPLWTTGLEGIDNHPDFKGGDMAISVIDVRQSRLQEIIKVVLGKLFGAKEAERYIHYGYEVVALSGRSARLLGAGTEEKVVHMSGRRGLYFNVDDVLDIMKEKAKKETLARNPDADPGWVEEVGEALAVSALRYQLVRADRNRLLVFDIEDSLKLEENTGPYLIYTYVRTRGILRKVEDNADISGVDPNVYGGEERELLVMVSKFPVVVRDAALSLEPQAIANYTYKLAALFNKFYEKYPVIKAEGEIRTARLALVKAVSQTLKNAFNLLGIVPLERM